MNLKYFVLAAIIAGCGGTSKKTVNTPEVSEVTKASDWKLSGAPSLLLIGEDDIHSNVRVAIVSVTSTLDSPDSKISMSRWSLIRLTGVEQEFNKVVFLVRWEEGYGGVSLLANIHGQPRSLLFRADNWAAWRHKPSTAYGHDDGWVMELVKDEEPDAEELLRLYQEQVQSGMMEKLAPVERKNREKAQELKLAEFGATLRDACGVQSLTIDWDTVDSSLFDDTSVANRCEEASGSLRFFCERYPNAVHKVKNIRNVSCDFSPESKESPLAAAVVRVDEVVVYVDSEIHDQYDISTTTYQNHWGEAFQVLSAEGRHFIVRYGEDAEAFYQDDTKRYFGLGTGILHGRSISLAKGIHSAALTRNRGDSDWTLRCGDEKLLLKRVVGSARDKILAAAKYEKEPKWNRHPYFLARDTRGTYYYVDRLKKKSGGRHYRVFVGRRGALKLTKLTGLVEDSEGTVFSTDKGELRLVVNKNSRPLWISNKKRNELTSVEVHRNARLIYDELGVYFGEDLGHVCD